MLFLLCQRVVFLLISLSLTWSMWAGCCDLIRAFLHITYHLGWLMVNCALILELGLWIFFSFDFGFVVSQDITGILYK